MLHSMSGLFSESMRFVSDEGDNHAVEIEKEHDQVETEFDKGFLEPRY